MTPERSPGLWQSQASQESPPYFQGVREGSFFLWEDKVCLGTNQGHLLLRDAPGAEGPYLNQHSLIRLQTFAQSLLCAKFLQPSRGSNQDTPQM